MSGQESTVTVSRTFRSTPRMVLLSWTLTSRMSAMPLASSWLSAVDMEAARMAERRMPEITPGKMRRTIWIKTVELSLISPRSRWPMQPAATEKIRISVVQVIPIFAERFRDFWLSTDMKRMMMCGMPK